MPLCLTRCGSFERHSGSRPISSKGPTESYREMLQRAEEECSFNLIERPELICRPLVLGYHNLSGIYLCSFTIIITGFVP